MENNQEDLQVVIRRMENKITSMEEVINKINHQVNPPFWKTCLKFIASNFFTILTLVSLVIITWKLWGIYLEITAQIDSINGEIEAIKSIPQSAGNTIKDLINQAGF